MMTKLFAVLFCVFVCSEAAFIDTLGKCSIKDFKCLAKLYTKSMSSVAKTGIPEYGIPPFDPFEIRNISVSVLNMVEIGMIDGVARDIKSCVFDRLVTSLEDLHASMDVTCDVTVKGHYKVATTNPMIQNVLGSPVRGEGFGKVKMEKLQFKFETDFFLREANDEIYIDWKYEDMHYSYTFRKVTFSANNLMIGEQEVSTQIIALMNDNWEFLMTNFGKQFVDVAMNIVDGYMHQFFDVTPARYYFIEDLTQYLKN